MYSPDPFALLGIWDHFQVVLLRKYALQYNGLNVVTGPVFDYNYDGLYDSADQIQMYVNSLQILNNQYLTRQKSCSPVKNILVITSNLPISKLYIFLTIVNILDLLGVQYFPQVTDKILLHVKAAVRCFGCKLAI